MSPPSTQKFSGIFVSYRRDDSSGHAGRLADGLVEHFGRDRIFVDVDTIEPGEDFVAAIENAVGSCDILIAVIGRNWLAGTGSGRLDNPNNFVRLEIATALRRNIRVIPVLVQRASMPKPQDLPEDLVPLTRRNAIELSDLRWQTDVEQLISVMERVLAKQRGPIEEVDRRKAAENTQRSGEDETADRQEREAPVGETDFAVRKDAPATLVTSVTTPPANQQRRFMLIAGALLIVLVAATIVIWQSQSDPDLSRNNTQAATPPPSLSPQLTPATPTPTPASSPTPEAMAFSEPTLWKRDDTGTIVQIVQTGNTLRARVVTPSDTARAAGRGEGDLAFEGSYDGRTIKGTAYLRFLPDDVSRCPDFKGEQPWDMELTLSADGNKLRGSRDDYVLSDSCEIVKRPRRVKLAYTKILR